MTAAVLLALLLDASGASAAPAPGAETVILLQPTTSSPATLRSVTRIRDELSADRFRVIVADASAAGDPHAVLDSGALATEAGTVLALFGDPDRGEAELCVVRRAAGRTAVRRATVVLGDPERIPETLAKRALELLRATALELAIEIERSPRAREPAPARAEAAVHPIAAPAGPAAEAALVTADLGVGVWSSVDGPPAAVAPVARIGVRVADWAWARVSVAGLGSRPRVDTSYGSAVLSQSVALLEAAAVLRRDKRVRPMFSLGAGVLNLAVVGTGAAPYESREPQQWSAAFDAGAGVAFAVGARAALVTELHALLAAPHPVVRFVDTRAATIGYPSLIFTMALRVAL